MLRAIAFGLVGYLIGGVIVRVTRGEAGSRSPPDHGGPFATPIIAKEISRGRAITD
jgi:hypothetical protein